MKQIQIPEGLLDRAAATLGRSLPGPNPAVNTPDQAGRIAGFGLGLWHGSIAPVTFIVSLFSEKVGVFEVHNNGKWYLLGFLLGVTGLWGGSRANAARRRRAAQKQAADSGGE